MRPSSTFSTAVTAGLALLWGAPAPAADYRDPGHHFSLTLPVGWRDMSGDAVSKANEVARQKFPDQDIRYDHGFLPAGKGAGSFPYILVQVKAGSTKGATYDDIEKGLRSVGPKIKRMEGSISDVAKGLSVGEVSLDRAHNRVILRLEMELVGVGKVQAIGFGFIGAKGIVFLHCYDRQADFERSLPVFLALADSFQYQPGYEFTPAPSSPLFTWPQMPSWAGSSTMVAAIVGGAVGGLIGVAAVVLQMFKRKAAPKEDPDLEGRDTRDRPTRRSRSDPEDWE
jgi:hypothetical protein